VANNWQGNSGATIRASTRPDTLGGGLTTENDGFEGYEEHFVKCDEEFCASATLPPPKLLRSRLNEQFGKPKVLLCSHESAAARGPRSCERNRGPRPTLICTTLWWRGELISGQPGTQQPVPNLHCHASPPEGCPEFMRRTKSARNAELPPLLITPACSTTSLSACTIATIWKRSSSCRSFQPRRVLKKFARQSAPILDFRARTLRPVTPSMPCLPSVSRTRRSSEFLNWFGKNGMLHSTSIISGRIGWMTLS